MENLFFLTYMYLVLFNYFNPECLFFMSGGSEEVGAIVNTNVESQVIKLM